MNQIEALLSKAQLSDETTWQLAKETGFAVRTPRKITPYNFLRLSLEESLCSQPSYNDMTARLNTSTGICASRQAVCKRVNDGCVAFMQAVLGQVMKTRTTLPEDSCAYGRILVQDSTVIRLPKRLYDDFSGVSNAHSTVCNARLQAVYDLLAGEFVSFSIDTYSKNDSTAAPELELRATDLVLRDRGYLSADEIQRHIDAGADCIYRHKHNTTYEDPQTGKPIDLLAKLRCHGTLDMDVRLSNGTVCRLVAAPVNEETANLRRRKLKKEQSGHAPSKELLQLASWTLLLTTIDCNKATFKQLLDLYGLRWRIEIIFKAWKSNMNFAQIHNVSKKQLLVLLAARLTMVVAFTHFLYRPLSKRMRAGFAREASLMKTIRYFARNPEQIGRAIRMLHGGESDNGLLAALVRYCAYDKRKRPCHNEEVERIVFGERALS
ncbi:MAG: IS4 family transposase [Gammaproteobacteria bacterium]|nr:MAG: IS4 family transposase [Gammaproteobacteria bacterium]